MRGGGKQNRCKPAIVIPAQYADLRVSRGRRVRAATRFRGPMCNSDRYQYAASRDMTGPYYRHCTFHGGLPNMFSVQARTPSPATKTRLATSVENRNYSTCLACIVRCDRSRRPRRRADATIEFFKPPFLRRGWCGYRGVRTYTRQVPKKGAEMPFGQVGTSFGVSGANSAISQRKG